MTTRPGPRVRANDWSVLDAPTPGAYTPARTVSVVVPAYQAHDTLPRTLAALAAQSYPEELLEVVVVDDGDGEQPVELPDLRPARTVVVRSEGSWGRAHACHTGATASTGDVIHWLDADMVPSRHQVAHHMRWHHVIDHAVVLGHKLFVDPVPLPEVAELHELALEDRVEDVFAGRRVDEHGWVEEIWRRSADLTRAGFRAFHVHVGSTASVGRALYDEVGGLDTSLKLGEDVELGYRLAMRGGVFVAERHATSWHLGRSHLMRYEKQVQRYNTPFVAQRVPDFRKFRESSGRAYQVPYVEVVVDATDRSWEQVKYTVDGVLRARPGDLHVRLLGRWGGLDDDVRRPLLGDERLDVRLLQEEYAADPRVSFVEELAPTAFPAQFRLHLPVGWRPGPESLERVLREMQRRSQGLRSILLTDGQAVRIERTAAFERALRVMTDDEDLDDVVDTVSETWWSDGRREGFEHVVDEPPTATTDPLTELAAEVRRPAAAAVPGDPTAGNGRQALARMMTALGKR